MYSKNAWIILIRAWIEYMGSVYRSILMLLGIRKNTTKEFPSLTSLLMSGPTAFKERPTGIRAGRSFFSLILSFFHYESPHQK